MHPDPEEQKRLAAAETQRVNEVTKLTFEADIPIGMVQYLLHHASVEVAKEAIAAWEANAYWDSGTGRTWGMPPQTEAPDATQPVEA